MMANKKSIQYAIVAGAVIAVAIGVIAVFSADMAGESSSRLEISQDSMQADADLQDNSEISSPSQESEPFSILQYGVFDAEDDGNLVDKLYVGEKYWFYLEYRYELDTRQDVRIFVTMQDKNTDGVLKTIDGHGFDEPEDRMGHGFEWVPEYEGEFKINGELSIRDDPLVSTVAPQYDFVVIEKP